ncbi:hypothetical protein FB45DRAFT_782955 [Roridomyces roridus]|uniref:Uncharacterized protein n=1 Tax=Roridomyces roridus TaxID=1738132 RepID=A0AAD7CGR6_9AGAR|nr:hypothetical protein FB45DRAFT_782955 [Roridomyces roridus]
MAEPTTSAPASSNLLGSFNFSNNLVEVGALTALIGSSAAESLVLGNRGAAGVAWAATSSFGTISVVKACFCGANSGWLRETLGIRTAASDSAVGLELPYASSRATKIRRNRNVGEPTAIFVHTSLERGIASKRAVQWSDVYALDHSASVMLRAIPDTLPGQPLQIFTYANYPFASSSDGLQLSAILLSTSKFVEAYFMWRHKVLLLGLVSAVPWVFFFIGAVAIQAADFIRSRRVQTSLGTLDLIAGKLPLVARTGGPRKVVLGAFENPRNSLVWRCFWAIGALACTTSITFTYIIMADQPRSVVFIWAGFQMLWLAVRMFVYHFVDATRPAALRMLGVRRWSTLSANLKMRVMDLTLSLSRLQSEIHPRGVVQYIDDSFSNSDLALISDGIQPPNLFPLPDHVIPSSSFIVEIRAVFGDTALSSAMWMTGAQPTPMDLYDSCIVVFAIRDSNNPSAPRRSIAVPSARVLSGSLTPNIPESNIEKNLYVSNLPKGTPNPGWNTSWWYWIPCQTGLWLQLQVVAGKTLGVHEVEVCSDGQVDALLSSGKLNISIQKVDELRAVVDLARRGREAFLELLS